MLGYELDISATLGNTGTLNVVGGDELEGRTCVRNAPQVGVPVTMILLEVILYRQLVAV